MTRFRLWLANLISGGEIERLEKARNDTRNFWFNRWDKAMVRWGGPTGREYHMRKALRDIIAMETPVANATVKRMAKRAREAL